MQPRVKGGEKDHFWMGGAHSHIAKDMETEENWGHMCKQTITWVHFNSVKFYCCIHPQQLTDLTEESESTNMFKEQMWKFYCRGSGPSKYKHHPSAACLSLTISRLK